MFEILERIANFIIVVGFSIIVVLIFRMQKKQVDALREGSDAEIRGLKQEIKF